MEVKSMIANAPSDSAFFAGCGSLVGLTFDAQIHDMVSTDGAVIDHNIPGPKGDCIPLFDFETLFTVSAAVGSSLSLASYLLYWRSGSRRSISHINVRHRDVVRVEAGEARLDFVEG